MADPIFSTVADITEVCKKCLSDYSEQRTNVIYYRSNKTWVVENYIRKGTEEMISRNCDLHPLDAEIAVRRKLA